MDIKPERSKKNFLYTVGMLCAGLTACDGSPRQHAPGIVPNDNPQQPKPVEAPEPEEIPQVLGGDVPYIPEQEDE